MADGLVCPRCHADTRVIDSRPAEKSIRRRRACLACEYRFTTLEAVDAPDPLLKNIVSTLEAVESQIRAARRMME